MLLAFLQISTGREPCFYLKVKSSFRRNITDCASFFLTPHVQSQGTNSRWTCFFVTLKCKKQVIFKTTRIRIAFPYYVVSCPRLASRCASGFLQAYYDHPVVVCSASSISFHASAIFNDLSILATSRGGCETCGRGCNKIEDRLAQ